MSTSRKIFSVLVIQLAALGIILAAIVVWAVWYYNTPATTSLNQAIVGAERVLTASDRGLTLINRNLNTARGAVNTIDGAVRATGDRIVETNLAFLVLERTVGDTLFPRILAAQETLTAITDTVVGVNDTLEAANRLPFVQVPTFTSELETAGGRLTSARTRVDEIRDGIRAIKEEKISRPISFITSRTGSLISDLDNVLDTTTRAQTRVNVTLSRLAVIRTHLARAIDLISIVVTLTMFWLIGNQGYVLIRAYENLAGKRIDWAGMRARLRRGDDGADGADGDGDGGNVSDGIHPPAAEQHPEQ